MDEKGICSYNGVVHWLKTRKSKVYENTRKGLLLFVDSVLHLLEERQKSKSNVGIPDFVPEFITDSDIKFSEIFLRLLQTAVENTFVTLNAQIAFGSLHGFKGGEWDHGHWVERQNAPSAIALRYGEDSIKMKQERHLEFVGLSRWVKSLNILRTTSNLPGRSDKDLLEQTLFPDAMNDYDETQNDELHFASAQHVADRAQEMEEDAVTSDALMTLGLLEMPNVPDTINAAVSKRKREGCDGAAIDQAAQVVRRKLFTM